MCRSPRSTTHTTWAMGCNCKPTFGMTNACLKRQSSRSLVTFSAVGDRVRLQIPRPRVQIVESLSSPSGSNCTRRAISRRTLISVRRGFFLTAYLPAVSTMEGESQRQKERDGVLFSLNMAIGALNCAREAKSVTPAAKATFTSAAVLLNMIRVGFLPVHVGRFPANMCRTQRSTEWTMSN